MQEPEIKRWTAKRKAELIKQIYRGQTTAPEAAREVGGPRSAACRTMPGAPGIAGTGYRERLAGTRPRRRHRRPTGMERPRWLSNQWISSRGWQRWFPNPASISPAIMLYSLQIIAGAGWLRRQNEAKVRSASPTTK